MLTLTDFKYPSYFVKILPLTNSSSTPDFRKFEPQTLDMRRLLNNCSKISQIPKNPRLSTSALNKFNVGPSRTHWIDIDDALFGLTDEQSQLRRTAHNFFKAELDEMAGKIDHDNSFPGFRAFMKKSAEMGFFGTFVPEEYGGFGDLTNLFDSVLINEELARISAGVELSFGAHSYLCMYQILKNGSHEQKKKFIPDLCAANTIGALAMSEHQSGSDVVSMQTTATKDGDYFLLNGSKMWITNGPIADIYVIYARTGKRHTAFIVDRREHPDTFTVGKPLDKLGIRGSPTGELVFENCRVHKENILGGEGNGLRVLFSGLNIERLTLACAPVGVMQACCDVAFSYSMERKQFGDPIGTNQLIQGKMADMYARLQSTRSYVYTICRAAEKGHFNNKDSAAVCLMAAENGTQTALDAIQILGGNGYINEYPTGRFLRDSKLYEIGGGTSEVRRWLIGREINMEYE